MGARARSSSIVLVAAAAAVLATTGVAAAEPPAHAPRRITAGPITLPLSGLQVTLPRDKRKDFAWQVASSFSLDANGAYDARDVVDELVKDKLVGGNWVIVGHFDAGGCAKVVAATAFSDAWSVERDQWGSRWSIRGGLFTFDSSLGKRPALVMCASREGRKQLLLYHFFLDREAMTQKAMLAALPRLPVLERAARAWRSDGTAPVEPLRRAEVRTRGAVTAARTVRLPVAGRDLALPDDGFVWGVTPPDGGADVDWLWRAAPALPEQSLEVMRVPGMACREVIATMTAAPRADANPRNLPAGWQPGPALLVNGALERTACLDVQGAAIVVGLQTVPDNVPEASDFGPLAPLLGALAAALK
ncbi:MAG: hypothetical protein HS111_28335 [Kofleriaceae bacterium]|nr:hypothetical protein [Kofleriaceae bacterium]MCL4223549.1 hypothetical protein [Myxococcales bacterium]